MRNLSFSMWQSRWRKQDTTILLSPFALPRADITTIGPADKSSHKISWTKGRTRPNTETSFHKTPVTPPSRCDGRILRQIFWTKIRPCPINLHKIYKQFVFWLFLALAIRRAWNQTAPGQLAWHHLWPRQPWDIGVSPQRNAFCRRKWFPGSGGTLGPLEVIRTPMMMSFLPKIWCKLIEAPEIQRRGQKTEKQPDCNKNFEGITPQKDANLQCVVNLCIAPSPLESHEGKNNYFGHPWLESARNIV